MEKRRVVVTGAGVVSALGGSRAELFEALLAGRCAVRRMPEWCAELPGVPLAAPVELDPEIAKRINRKFRRSMGPAALFASLAALQAAEESGLDAELLGSGRTGCAVSSTMGSSSSIVEATALLLSGRREEMPATQFFKCASHSSRTCSASTECSFRPVRRALPGCSRSGRRWSKFSSANRM